MKLTIELNHIYKAQIVVYDIKYRSHKGLKHLIKILIMQCVRIMKYKKNIT